MRSVTKTELSLDQIEELVGANFGEGAGVRSVRELKDGYFNTAYRLELTDGEAVVLKVAPPDDVPVLRYERGILGAEVEVLRLLRARTSLPVPEVHAYDDTRTRIAQPYYFMSHMGGERLDKVRRELSPDAQRALDVQIGGYLRELNGLKGPAFGYLAPHQPRFDDWASAFDAMLTDIIDDGRAIGVTAPMLYAELVQRMRALYPALEEVETPHLVHWDLWDGNIFIDRSTLTVTGIVDCERALWGDPLMEFNFRVYDAESGFAEGYGRPMLDTPSARTRRLLYDLHLYLIMVIECDYRQYPSTGQRDWARGQLARSIEALTRTSYP